MLKWSSQIVAVGLLVCAGPRSGAAAEPCADHMERKALKQAAPIVEHAKEALMSGQFDAALRLYQQAYCLLPDPGLRRGLSAASLNLGLCRQALDHARFWLEHAAKEEASDARRWLDNVQGQCRATTIQSQPTGAALYLDGAGEAAGTAPFHGWLRVGSHSVIARKEGCVEETKTFQVPHGQGSIEVMVPLTPLAVAEAAAPAAQPPLPPIEGPGPPGTPAAPPPVFTGDLPPIPSPEPPPASLTLPPKAVEEAPPKNESMMRAAWSMLAVAGAATVAASVTGSTVLNCQSSTCLQTNSTATNVMWGLAGASAVTAGALFLSGLVPSRHAVEPEKTVSVDFVGNGLVATARF